MQKNPDVALAIIRLIVGGIFVAEGWYKIMHLTQTAGFFVTIGIPAFLAYLVTIAEFFGGLSILTGFISRFSAAVLAIVMFYAIFFVTWGAGFYAPTGPALPLAAFGLVLSLVFSGPGKYSFSAWYNRRSMMASASPMPAKKA